MSTPLNFGRDVQGYNSYAPQPSTDIYNATITAGGATSITVPSNYQVWIASFSYQPGSSVWVDFTGATAAVPAGATLASATSMLNPGQRTVYAGGNISLISADSSDNVSIELYPVSYP